MFNLPFLEPVLKRIEALEKRPDVIELDPDTTYIVVVPDGTVPDEVDSLAEALRQHPNVTVIAAEKVKIIQVI